MAKILKKVYIPSGLIASMYNLYGGSGDSRESLSMYDIQLLCAYTEYYFNYTNPESKDYAYYFYTLPYVYTANENDNAVASAEDEIKEKYTTKVIDEESSESGPLYIIYKTLTTNKKKKFKKPNAELPESAYELGAMLQGKDCLQYGKTADKLGGFRIGELYRIKTRRESEIGSVDINIFDCKIYKDLSTFFILRPEYSKEKLSDEEFSKNDEEMRTFLQKFFNSGCYKLLAKDKTREYAPDVDVFINRFHQAVDAYKKLGFVDMNKNYINKLNEFKANNINFCVVQD